MRFTDHQLDQILEDFPNFELSYEKKLHKKVQSDIYLTIPKGKKYFASSEILRLVLGAKPENLTFTSSRISRTHLAIVYYTTIFVGLST